jgi:hypothetical protein
VRRALVAILFGSLVLAASARAQHDGGGAGVPDVPAGPGRLVGTIENPDAPTQVADVEILLYALPPGGTPGLRRARSDAQGHFVFEGIANDTATAYLVGARYAGIPYPGERLAFTEGQQELRVAVRVGEPTESAREIAIVESQLEIAWAGGRLGVAELIRFENRGDRTAFVAAPRRAEAGPLFRATLPAGAEEFQIPLGIQPEGLVRDGAELRFYGPVYPSSWPGPLAREQGLAFQYTLPSPGGPATIEKVFPSGAQRVVVVTQTGGPKIEVAGAREETSPAPVEPADATPPSRRLVVDRVPPGGRVTLRVALPETRVDPDAVHLEETRIFLELDDAALQVQEQHLLRVDAELPVVGPDGAPLLAIPVPAGAVDVRFDRDAFALGLAPDDGVGALLHGPLPPGESSVQISYHLPLDGGEAIFEKRFGRTLPLLSIYVADTGIRAESERLHRRRPVRTTDRTYLALEAFQVDPSETVRLSLAPLGAPLQLPRFALFGAVALAAGVAASFLFAPLRGGDGVREALPEDATRSEREAVYASLRDLEHDHETAKLSDEDYASMRAELRARAAEMLRAERATSPSAAVVATPATPDANACRACGTPARAGDRFCAHCGAGLGEPGAAEARA